MAALTVTVLIASLGVAGPAGADTAPRRIVSGWLPHWAPNDSTAVAIANADLWRDASPFWYQAEDASTITALGGADDIAGMTTQLRSKGILVIPTVTETLNAKKMAALLADPAQRTAHVEALTGLVADGGYDGIDLNYESMNTGGTAAEKAKVRDGFVVLLKQLGPALDASGKLLSVTVGAKTSATSGWTVHDYAGIGKVADRFRIMAYDFHWKGGPAGPVAPLPWVERVLSYAVTVVPKGKIQLGVPLYGYDWAKDPSDTKDGWGTGVTKQHSQATRLLNEVNATRQWSAKDSTPYFTYVKDGVQHQVWYEDAQSTLAKTRLVGKYGIQGVVFWHPAYEDKSMWTPLRNYAIRRSTALSVAAPPVVTHGAAVTVTGTLTTTSGAAVKSEKVTLEHQEAGSTTWKAVASGTTSATGTVSFSTKPAVNGSHRLRTAGSWSYLPVTSPAVVTKVRYKATGAFTDATVKRNVKTTFKGTVTPGRKGTKVFLQRQIDGVWKDATSTTTSATGAYSFTFAWSKAGTYTYRARVPDSKLNAAATTPARTLEVS